MSQYFEEVKRQINLLVRQDIDANDYLKWIIKNPWDTSALIDRLVDLKSKFPAYFQNYNELIKSHINGVPRGSVRFSSDFVQAFLKLEQALVDAELEEADRSFILDKPLLVRLLINKRLEFFITLRKQGCLSLENRHYIEKHRDYAGFFVMLDLPEGLEEKTPNLVEAGGALQSVEEKKREPGSLQETKTLPQAQKEIVFMSAYTENRRRPRPS